eukprot:5496864-Amphidinium_carterae.1
MSCRSNSSNSFVSPIVSPSVSPRIQVEMMLESRLLVLRAWIAWWSWVMVLSIPGSLYTAIRAVPELIGVSLQAARVIHNSADLLLTALTNLCFSLVHNNTKELTKSRDTKAIKHCQSNQTTLGLPSSPTSVNHPMPPPVVPKRTKFTTLGVRLIFNLYDGFIPLSARAVCTLDQAPQHQFTYQTYLRNYNTLTDHYGSIRIYSDLLLLEYS